MRHATGQAGVMAARGRRGGLSRWRRYGNVPGAVTPRVKGGRVMATHGIVELLAHGFGGERETALQRAYRTGTPADRDLYAAPRRLAHRKCYGQPCRRCQQIIGRTLERRTSAPTGPAR